MSVLDIDQPNIVVLVEADILTSAGFTKPMGPLPAAVRSSLMSVRTEAKMGDDRLVPKMRSSVPLL